MAQSSRRARFCCPFFISTDAAHTIPAVQIAEPEPEPGYTEGAPLKKQFSAGLAKRLSGRPPAPGPNASKTSLLSQTTLEALTGHSGGMPANPSQEDGGKPHHAHRQKLEHVGERFMAQVADWLENERIKKQSRTSRIKHHMRRRSHKGESEDQQEDNHEKQRRCSIDSNSSEVSFDRLQKIIDDSISKLGLTGVPHYNSKAGRKSQRSRRPNTLHRTASSDTEYHDGDVHVPSCNAELDNSKSLAYSGGDATAPGDDELHRNPKLKTERQAWILFKNDIIRLAHTLRLKGWRRVPLDSGESIGVERLSGALTNAVYVVSPPADIDTKVEAGKKHPSKLLLRVYGPQVEHIIDRDYELSVLRRLARKKIGPRLLGTFLNGRFEQFLNAITLTSEDLKDAETSTQIAKRMRELHDGIELLEEEREGGPAVWKNWDYWLDRVSQMITFLDQRILSGNLGPVRNAADAWKTRGLVCGVEWAQFKQAVDKYRDFVSERYGGMDVIREQLVFAHNDTQYGNILRMRPDDKKSPLLQPHYEHKQLVVIDFEYAAANVRGLEFANHFTEWCYDYTDEQAPFAIKPERYPKPEEQYRFIKSYVTHRPEYQHPGASTPVLSPLDSSSNLSFGSNGITHMNGNSSSSIVDFMLDARVPLGGWKEEEKRQDEQVEKEVKALMEETRLWRVANSAQWVAWGIMQAHIPGFQENAPNGTVPVDGSQPTSIAPPEDEEQDPNSFDYLGYAQERAMFFWSDCVLLGIVKEEDLPEEVRRKLKFVDY
ncbi:protein kinase-like domain-containing protein [Xylariomycetidae sp. FL0641]|nr:protein kinase-like domain-containing protein [Xylariomycetidae sp. FL0641]